MIDYLFEREVSKARTFGFLHEVEYMKSYGLARGGSLDNAVVMDESRVLNRDGLRWTDEFVRHKVLDLIGDLALIGMPIEGHIVVERGGHALHQQLITEILKRPEAWRIEGPVVPTRGAPDLASLQAPVEAPA